MSESRICPHCNASFILNRKDKKYCSRSCKTHAKDRRTGYYQRRKAIRAKPYIVYKKTSCEFCGFLPVHTCQLDVDHIDGNHSNNEPSNLQTLCANCHRLKTFLNKDWEGTP